MPITMTKPALRQLRGRSNLIGAEIGIYLGRHASFYLRELDIKYVFLVDPYTGYKNYSPTKVGLINLIEAEKIAHTKLRDYGKKVKWIREESAEAAELIANDSLDFVYIDANHAYESVVEDIFLYYPKMKKDGLFSGHDYDYEGVKRAVDEFVDKQNSKLHIEDMGPGQFGGKGMKYDWWIWKEIIQ